MSAPPSSVIFRERLLSRLATAEPRILAIIAPAGFGKSTLARQYSQGLPASATCDLLGVADEAEFVRRLTAALAAEAPERTDELIHLQLSIGEGGPSDADKMAMILQAWSRQGQPSTFIFENVERVDNASSVLDVLWRLLAARPPSRTVVICSRSPLRARLSRFADPHHIVSVRAQQLSFDRTELGEAFAGTSASREQIDRVLTISRGWPIAVLLFVRFAREGTLGELLDHLDDVAFENLHDYLAEQVLTAWSGEALDVLAACACIPGATIDDVAYALGDAEVRPVLDDIALASPFVTRSAGGEHEVHPLLRSALLEANKDRRVALLTRAADAWSSRGAFERAARLLLESGDVEAAADALDKIDIFIKQVYSVEYTSVLAALPMSVVARHPRLWYGTVHLRRYRIDNRILLREAQALWPSLASKSVLVRSMVCVFYALLASDFGDNAKAEELVRSLAAELEQGTDPAEPAVQATSASLRHILGAALARSGRLTEAAAAFDRAWPVASQRPISAAVAAMNRAGWVERILGCRESERELLDLAIDHAEKTGFATMVARAHAEATFGAWFGGDEQRFNDRLAALEGRVEADAVRGFSHFVACARGRDDQPLLGIEEPAWLFRAHLVAWSSALDDERAVEHAEAAISAADSARDPAAQAIARIALAAAEPARRAALCAEARAFAACVESEAFRTAIEGAANGHADAGILTPMLRARMRRPHAPQVPPLEIEFMTAAVRRHGEPVKLVDPERRVLLGMAIARRPMSVKELASSLWPAMDQAAAVDALDHGLMRLRVALGPDAFIETSDGYRLCERARVDLWEIGDAVNGLRRSPSLDEADRSRLHALHDTIRINDKISATGESTTGAAARQLREYRREIAERLGRDALARRAPEEALSYAREMAEYDKLDEGAREIAIQAFLNLGNNAAALKEYENYRDILKDEIDARPSGRLADQVKETFGTLLHPDTLFDVGADAVNLIVPGGGIALRVVKAITAKRRRSADKVAVSRSKGITS